MVEQSGGWAMPGPEDFSLAVPPPEMPSVTVKRGGIRWPLFQVYVKVFSRCEGFWRRKRWYVEITERRMEHALTDIVGPLSESAARHVKKAVDAMVAMHNDMHAEEADRWSRS